MPKILLSAKVLGGLAEVVAFERGPTAFFLRVYKPETRSYSCRRIQSASTLSEAQGKAAEVYRQFMQPGPVSGPKRGTKPGTKLRPRKNNIRELVDLFLVLQQDRVKAGEITELTLKGKSETVNGHLLAFCDLQGIASSQEITIDTFKGYTAYRSHSTPNTKRKELGYLREFLAFLAERDALRSEVEAKRHLLLPKIKKTGEDNMANPQLWRRIGCLSMLCWKFGVMKEALTLIAESFIFDECCNVYFASCVPAVCDQRKQERCAGRMLSFRGRGLNTLRMKRVRNLQG
jgi:hypothetical protein